MKQDNILAMLGLAQKAGKVVSGEYAVEKAVKGGSAYLVIIAQDASDLTKKKYRDMTAFYHVPLVTYAAKQTLGASIGKELRACAALTDPGFADSIQKKISVLQQ